MCQSMYLITDGFYSILSHPRIPLVLMSLHSPFRQDNGGVSREDVVLLVMYSVRLHGYTRTGHTVTRFTL